MVSAQGVSRNLDRRKITRIEFDPKGFRLLLSDGEAIVSRRVVVAAGINSFAWRPPDYRSLPAGLMSRCASEHSDFRKFAGKQVLIIGGGQSALESAALLHESGATTEVIVRSRIIHWLGGWASKISPSSSRETYACNPVCSDRCGAGGNESAHGAS